MFSRKAASTGIDLGRRAIKLVRLEIRGSQPVRLTHWGSEELPTPGEAPAREQTAALERLLARLDLKPRHLGHVASALGGRDVHLRQASLPRIAPHDLRRALPYEAKKHLPLEKVAHPCLDFQILEGPAATGEDTQEVLLVAAPQARKDQALNILNDVGIHADVLDARPLPAVNAILEAHPHDHDAGWVIVLDLGAASSILAAVLPDGGFYARPLEFTGDGLTRSIEESLHLDRQSAETMKRELDGSALRLEETGLAAPIQGLVQELIETIRFLRLRQRARPVSRIYLCGGGALLAGLRERLAAVLQIEVMHPDPFQELSAEDGRRPHPEEGICLTEALGLAQEWPV